MNIAKVEDCLVVISEPTGVGVYDFDFDLHFRCSHPSAFDDERCVLRVGAIPDYEAAFAAKAERGLRLVNTPAQHLRASEIEHWLPAIQDLTPRTRVFDELPPADEIARLFGWPVFIKGSRQTSKHAAALSVIRDAQQYAALQAHWPRDPILHWQRPAVREFTPLQRVPGEVPGGLPPSMEFRSFWWEAQCVGVGRYWHLAPPYACDDLQEGLAVAQRAAGALEVSFLVVDFAKTADGRWIVIECNDAQESGYAAVAPRAMWQAVIDRTR